MHALTENLDREIADDGTAQRRRHPELFIVAAAAVEADHEARRPDFLRQQVDVGGQVERSALLAAFDDDHDARMWRVLRLYRANGGDGREDGVAVISAAASEE